MRFIDNPEHGRIPLCEFHAMKLSGGDSDEDSEPDAFTASEKRTLKESYARFARKHGSGWGRGPVSLDLQGFSRCAGQMTSGHEPSHFIRALFYCFAGSNGFMNEQQFMQCMQQMVLGDETSKLKLMYKMITSASMPVGKGGRKATLRRVKTNAGGFTADDLAKMMRGYRQLEARLGDEVDAGDDEEWNDRAVIDRIFSQLDTSADGVVSFEEFAAAMRSDPMLLMRRGGNSMSAAQILLHVNTISTKLEEVMAQANEGMDVLHPVSPRVQGEEAGQAAGSEAIARDVKLQFRRAHVLAVRVSLLSQELRHALSDILEIDPDDTPATVAGLEMGDQGSQSARHLDRTYSVEAPGGRGAGLSDRVRMAAAQSAERCRQLDAELARLKKVKENATQHRRRGSLLDELAPADLLDNASAEKPRVLARRDSSVLSLRGGQIIALGDAKWDRALTVMKGLQNAAEQVRGFNGKLRYVDFHSEDSYPLDKAQSSRTAERIERMKDKKKARLHRETAVQQKFFVDIAPRVFFKLRRLWRIKTDEYINSVGYESFARRLEMGQLLPMSGAPSAAKGGGFFYFSPDNKYFIKSFSATDKEMMIDQRNADGHTWLWLYYHHIKAGGSSLCKFCGLHKITNIQGEETFFVVMANVNGQLDCPVERLFDLKGSTGGRSNPVAANWCLGHGEGQALPLPPGKNILKDLDVIALGKSFRITAAQKETLMKSLSGDAALLAKCGLLDYSLLVGVVHNDVVSASLKTQAHRLVLQASRWLVSRSGRVEAAVEAQEAVEAQAAVE